MTADLPDFLVDYMEQRAASRAEEVNEHTRILRGVRHLAGAAIEIAHGAYTDAKKRVRDLHAPVQHMGQTWCGECSVRRSTGPRTEEWVAFIPHPCPTINALENKEA